MALTRPRAAQIYDIDYKQATRVVTVVNITLSGGAPSSVDGVNLSLNDRVLVTGQSTASQNGIYYVTTLGSGSNGTWSRSLDTNSTGEILTGTIVMVTEGNIYADTQWKLITDGVITVGVTDQVWTQNYSANSISGGTSNVVVNSNANVTISSAGTSNVLVVSSTGTIVTGTESVTGNITGGNVLTVGLISATGNVTGNYFLGNVFFANGITASKIYSGNSEVNVTASGGNVNVSIGGTSNVAVFTTAGEYITGLLSVSGNTTAGNVLTGGLISATGNVTGNYFLGNVACASGIFSTKIFSGTTEANIVSANGNLAISVGGTSNVAVFATTGEYVTGLVSVTGNATAGNILTAGLASVTGNVISGNISTAGLVTATGNVTGGNILTAGLISATANVTGGNLLTAGLISATGTITSAGNLSLTGNIVDTGTLWINTLANGNINLNVNGTGQTNIPAGILSVTANVTGGNILTGGLVSATGNVTGAYLKGNASQVTGINTFNQIFVTGTNTINASGLTSNVTFTAGNNISLTSVSNVITIAYSASGGGSIFATGGDMGLISQAVTASEDLGDVTTLADTSYDLGTLFDTVTYNQIDMTGFTSNINTGNLNAVGLANIVGNINGGNILTAGIMSSTGNAIHGNLMIAVDAYIGNATGIPTATLHLAAGAAAANGAPLKFTAGTNLTTAEAGAMEFNGNALYFSTAAGNRGVIPTPYFYRTGANRVLSNVTTGQSWLGVGVTLQANTTYQFTGQFYITTTDTASHVEQIGFGGTATLANIFYQVVRANAVTGTPNATTSSATQYFIANTLANTTAAVAVAANSVYTLNGTVSTNATGTFIPQWAANATTTGNTATVVSGAYFSISPVASGNGIISIGTWA